MSGVLKPNKPIRGRVVAKEVLLVGDILSKTPKSMEDVILSKTPPNM